jgi:pyruvate carboxylase subunit B
MAAEPKAEAPKSAPTTNTSTQQENELMANGTYTVIVDGQHYNVQIVDGNATVQSSSSVTAAPAAVAAPAASTGGTTICAELPGSVFKMVASVGDNVIEGDKIMILEAMKMEIDVIAPVSGKVLSLHVNVNDKIDAGQPLAQIG